MGLRVLGLCSVLLLLLVVVVRRDFAVLLATHRIGCCCCWVVRPLGCDAPASLLIRLLHSSKHRSLHLDLLK